MNGSPRSSALMEVSVGDGPSNYPMIVPSFRNVFFPLGNLRSGKPWPSGGVTPFFDTTGIGYIAPAPSYLSGGYTG